MYTYIYICIRIYIYIYMRRAAPVSDLLFSFPGFFCSFSLLVFSRKIRDVIALCDGLGNGILIPMEL